MKRMLGMAVWLCVLVKGNAQAFSSPATSVDLGSTAYSLRFADVFSFEANPAKLAATEIFQAGISCENRWMLKELAFYRMAASFPAGQGGMGIVVHYSGESDSHESELGMVYAKSLGRIELGLELRYDAYHAAGYSDQSFGSVMPGLRFHPSEKIVMGLAIRVPVFGGTGKSNPEKASSGYRMGIGYEVSPAVLISLQWIKEAGLPINVIASLDYNFDDQFFAAFGLESISTSPSIKSGWKKNRLGVELFTAYHPVLGFTPGLALFWTAKKKSG